MPYEDGADEIVTELNGTIENVDRASTIEWERNGRDSGWSVRSAKEPKLAARLSIRDGLATIKLAREGDLILFLTREAALLWERDNYWKLMEEK